MPLTVTIVTPERALPTFTAEHLTLLAADGEVGLRTGHAPLVAQLKPGAALVRSEGKERRLALKGGVVQVLKDQVKIFVDGVDEGA